MSVDGPNALVALLFISALALTRFLCPVWDRQRPWKRVRSFQPSGTSPPYQNGWQVLGRRLLTMPVALFIGGLFRHQTRPEIAPRVAGRQSNRANTNGRLCGLNGFSPGRRVRRGRQSPCPAPCQPLSGPTQLPDADTRD